MPCAASLAPPAPPDARVQPGTSLTLWTGYIPDRSGSGAARRAGPAENLLNVSGTDASWAGLAPMELVLCVAVSFLDLPDLQGKHFAIGVLHGDVLFVPD